MGKDIPKRENQRSGRTREQSTDPYLHLLVQLYTFLERRTSAPFNTAILKRLRTSRINKQPVSLSKIVKNLPSDKPDTIVVVIANIVNDPRLVDLPKLSVCALKVSDSAKARILKAGGRVLTLDQLAVERPTGSDTVLLRGRIHAREATKHFRGLHGNSARPYVREGKRKDKFERARGKRHSVAFKRTKAPIHGY